MCPQRTDYTNERKSTEGLSFTRKQEQQRKVAQTFFPQTGTFEEPAESTQNLSPCPSYHYALDVSSGPSASVVRHRFVEHSKGEEGLDGT